MERLMRSNILARTLALLLAVVLWLFVTGDKITRTTPSRMEWQDVPLRIENLATDHIVTEIPNSVNLTLEGLTEDFADLTMQEMDVFVDLAGMDSGSHLVRVQGRPPRGMSLIALEPERVRVTIETYHSSSFPVDLELIGEPADDWALLEESLEPEEVLIGAPQSIFQDIEIVSVMVDMTGMRVIERLDLRPVAYDGEGNPIGGLMIDPATVNVRLEFERVRRTELEQQWQRQPDEGSLDEDEDPDEVSEEEEAEEEGEED